MGGVPCVELFRGFDRLWWLREIRKSCRSSVLDYVVMGALISWSLAVL